jgi:hypothetical protein
MSVLGLYFLYKVFFESCYFSADRFDRLVVRGFADLATSRCRNVYGLGQLTETTGGAAVTEESVKRGRSSLWREVLWNRNRNFLTSGTGTTYKIMNLIPFI